MPIADYILESVYEMVPPMAHHDLDYDRLRANRNAVELVASAEHPIGAVVYCRIKEDRKGIVSGYVVRNNGLLYCVVWPGEGEGQHDDFELSATPIYNEGAGA